MSDPNSQDTIENAAGPDGGDASAEQAEGERSGWAGGPDQPADPAAELERLEAEKADLTDRLLRLAADMDNLRRRTEREIADARKYAVAKFAGDMLVVNDNLQRALDAVPGDRERSGEEGFKALIEGVELTRREMERLLARNGVTRIAAEGERFDPNRHQAVFEIPKPDVPAGTVVQVMQEGFTLGDRVLRAAMVGVSKDGPAAEPDAGQAAAPADAEA